MSEESTPSPPGDSHKPRGGSVFTTIFLLGVGLLWFSTALGSLMGLRVTSGLMQLTSGPSVATVGAAGISAAVLACVVGAWRDAWWGWIGLVVINGGFAIVALLESLVASGLVFAGIACFALLLFAMSRANDDGE
jgi:hypothetical protein